MLLLLMLSFTGSLASSDDFYELLDIDKSASTKDIRKAFKKMALKMHPDKNSVSISINWHCQ